MKRRKADIASEMEQNDVVIKTEDIQTTSAETTQNMDDGSLHDNPKSVDSGEKCYKCGEVFSDSSDLMEHMMTHRLQKTNTCPICSERFCRSRALKEHLMTHTGYRPYRCSVCSKGFKRASRLKEHMMTHTGGKCSTARKVSESKLRPVQKGAVEVIQTFTAETPQDGDGGLCHDNPKSVKTVEKCYKCGEVFGDPSDLMEHMRTHQGQKPNTGAVGSERFCRSRTLKEHLMTHTGYRPYRCSVCSKGFIHASSLQEHMTTHKQGKCNTASKVSEPKPRPVGGGDAEGIQSSTGETPQNGDDGLCHDNPKSVKTGERCHKCGEVFGDSSELMEHMMSHRGQVLSTCSLCSKRLTSPLYLREHMMTHTGYRPNKCSVCDKGYIRSSDLRRHMKSHPGGKSTQETGNITHKCPLCNEKFAESSMLHQHMQIHFKMEPAEHRCFHCSKLFQHSQDLYRHTTAHTCLDCNQSFCQLSYLNKHSKSHTGQKDTEFSKSDIKKGFKELSKLLKQEKSDDEMKLGHSSDTATRKLRVYSCMHCGKGFANLDDANTHVQMHVEKAAPSMNLNCDKDVHIKTEGTSHTTGLNGHIDKHKLKILRTQSGRMLYLCSVCGESFEALPTACSHILSH